MKPIFLFFFLPFAFLMTESKKNNNSQQIPTLSVPADITGTAVQLNSFPLKTGNTWTYPPDWWLALFVCCNITPPIPVALGSYCDTINTILATVPGM